MEIKEQILNSIPNNDYTVLNSSEFMKIIDSIGVDEFHSKLKELMNENLIRYDMASDGIMIYKTS